MKTIFALMLAGAFLTSPIARAGDEAPAASDTAKPKKKSKKKDAAPAAEKPAGDKPAGDKKEEAPAPEKKAEKGGW